MNVDQQIRHFASRTKLLPDELSVQIVYSRAVHDQSRVTVTRGDQRKTYPLKAFAPNNNGAQTLVAHIRRDFPQA